MIVLHVSPSILIIFRFMEHAESSKQPISTEEGPRSVLQRVRDVLAPGGSLVGSFSLLEIDALKTAEFSVTHSTAKDGSAFVLARPIEQQPDYPFSNTDNEEVILVSVLTQDL